ncbi:thiamine phosphate synthase [Brevibacillus borstelensis]|uniref:thiamine phosphate synthase n=1 Tax=Brevibacillus TaxID=55080 RepID=UPI00046879A7|nr:thiamine phosphate synthase [Brevibacillus borstelensis]MED1885192.1 thiamine phosphate synthase [Brevibacillus borstelensis]RNB62657.1 thiamine phosphate synthase [Brevibacillus borstelensis]GED53566.1 thiamine-phosphate synthase [Brevibacillus borstelensis]
MRNTERLREKMGVYFVVGTQDCGYSAARTLEIVEQALKGGAGTLQLRDKGSKLTREEKARLGAEMKRLAHQYQAIFFVNDDVDLAIDLQADGVHVGQDDMHLKDVRALVGESMYIGVSAGTVEEAREAMAGGADCIGVGAMYATASKADAGEPIGPAGLGQIREAVGGSLPIVGIGGITLENAAAVLAAGADGVAVISAISKAASPEQAARELNEVVNRTRNGQPR